MNTRLQWNLPVSCLSRILSDPIELLHLSKANLNFCQFQASLVISPVIKKAEAESFCPAPATMILRDSFRKGEKFQNQIISGTSLLFV
jgi:hypothetical protein